ncbi:MAG: alpha/beta fold hydrolase [Terriglobales bacterium]
MKRTAVVVLVVVCAMSAWAQAVPKSGFFTTSDSVRIHYLEVGTGPAIVFIPGWTMPAWIWEKQIAYFAPKYHVIAVDPRSQGESDKVADGNYPERRARDYKELVEHLRLTRPVLVGWSMGVHELLTYADQFGTETVGGLVLVEGFLWDKPDPQTETRMSRWMHGLQRDRRNSTEEFVRAMYRKPQSDEYFRRVTEAALRTPTHSAVVLIYNLIDREDWTPVLGKLAEAKTPVLAILAPPHTSTVDLIRAKVPNATVVMFEDAGHALFVDEPERFNTAVEKFITGAAAK